MATVDRQDPDPRADLHVTLAIEGDRAELIAEGNLDDFTAGLLRRHLSEAAALGARRFVVTLRHVGLIDSSGLSALVFGYKLALRGGGEFTLQGDDRLVARLLQRTGLDRVIPLRPVQPTVADGQDRTAAS
ncbi:MAG TPA: STAS domain-containing protein [Thermoleophilia bacterium]|nr:STAS domain-containing protein [Thermoleophilia bacterium]